MKMKLRYHLKHLAEITSAWIVIDNRYDKQNTETEQTSSYRVFRASKDKFDISNSKMATKKHNYTSQTLQAKNIKNQYRHNKLC